MADLFSVVAMFILFREALEASIIIAVMLQMCERLRLTQTKKQVWWGALAGISVSLVLGIAFVVVFYVTRTRVFSGKGEAIFKGYINLFAAFLIALLAFAMLRFMNYEKKWERKLAQAASKIDGERGSKWAVFTLAFLAVFREGMETVIFLAGVSSSVAITAIPLAGVVGIAMGVAVGLILYYTGRQIKDLKWFFVLSCILLFLIAAGLVSRGMAAWQAVGWFGTVYPAYARPWWNKPLWDTSRCCSDDVAHNKFFGLMAALFGYSARPTFISLFAYFGFWAIMIFDIVVKYCRGTLNDAMKGKGDVDESCDPDADPTAPPHIVTPMHLHDPKEPPSSDSVDTSELSSDSGDPKLVDAPQTTYVVARA